MKKILLFLYLVFLFELLNINAQEARYNGWLPQGNSWGNNTAFLGTTDARSFRIKTNGIERAVMDSATLATLKLNTNFFIDQSAGISSISPKKFSIQPWTYDNNYLAMYGAQDTPGSTNFMWIGDTTLNKFGAPKTLYLGQGGSNGLQIIMNETHGNTGTDLAASGHYFFTSGPATNTVPATKFIDMVVYPALTYSLGGGIVPTAFEFETIRADIKSTTATTITEWATANFPKPLFDAGVTVTRMFGVQTNTDISVGGRGIFGITGTAPTHTVDVRGTLNVTGASSLTGITNTGNITTTGTGSVGSTFTVGGAMNANSTLSVSSTATLASTLQLGTANAVLTGGNTGTVAVVSDNLFSFQFGWNVVNPADGATYFLNTCAFNGNISGNTRIALPVACTLIGYSYNNINLSINGTAESATLNVKQNATTTTSLNTSITFSATTFVSDFTKNISFAAGDDFSPSIVCPTWPITNPLGCVMTCVFYFKRQ